MSRDVEKDCRALARAYTSMLIVYRDGRIDPEDELFHLASHYCQPEPITQNPLMAEHDARWAVHQLVTVLGDEDSPERLASAIAMAGIDEDDDRSVRLLYAVADACTSWAETIAEDEAQPIIESDETAGQGGAS